MLINLIISNIFKQTTKKPNIYSHHIKNSIQVNFQNNSALINNFNNQSNIKKKQQNSTFISSSILFLLSVCVIGGYAFIKLIDKNQSKMLIYKIREFKEKFSFKKVNQKDKQQKQIQRNIEHEQNLKQMYDQEYKHRSGFNMKFLSYLDDYLNQKLLNNPINLTKQNKLGQNLFYILQNLTQKLLAKQAQKKVQKTDNYFLSILQKFMYKSLNSQKLMKQVIDSKSFVQMTLQKMSKCLLIEGNINQQILAYKILDLLIKIKVQRLQKAPTANNKASKATKINFTSFFNKQQLIQLKTQLINNELKLITLQNSSKTSNLSPLQKLNKKVKQQQKINQLIKTKILTFNKIIKELIVTKNDKNDDKKVK